VRDLERERAARRQAEEAPPPPPPAAAPAPAPAAGDDARARAEHERAEKAEAKLAEARKKIVELERELKGARGRLETDRRVYMVQKGELDVAHDRHADLRRRYDALRKEHDELIDAVRQAAREDRRLAQDASPGSAAEPAGSEPKPAGAP
jgi:chromosome segregation ATPase